jgi:FkbM family methyltransferase
MTEYHISLDGIGADMFGYDNDHICRIEMAAGRFYEPQLLTHISNLDIDPKVIIDCGAHIGNHTVYFAKRYPDAKIYSFEPNLSNYELLVKNTENLENVTTCNVALGDTQRRVATERIPGFDDMGCVRTVDGDEVDMVTLDEYDLNPEIIKIDTENNEHMVLAGAHETIERCHPIIFAEANTTEYRDQLDRILSRYGYTMRRHFSEGGQTYEWSV